MRNKKIFKRLMAAVMCSALLATAPTMTYATEAEATETNLEADENGFIIEDGVLIGYVGDATDITIPSNVMAIGGRAFRRCTTLESITVPGTVKTIGGFAFEDCKGLKKITLEEGVETIETGGLCNGYLREVTIPASVTSIGPEAIHGGNAITEYGPIFRVYVMKGSYAEEYVSANRVNGESEIAVVYEGGSAIRRGNVLVGYKGKDTTLTIPDNVTQIERLALKGCDYVNEIIFPAGIERIGISAFEGTAWLENSRAENQLVIVDNYLIDGKSATGEVLIPETITVIAEGAFRGNDNITKVIIPENVTELGEVIFDNCKNLKEVVIPASVTEISPETPEGSTFCGSEDLVICGEEGSYAQQFASENGFAFKVLGQEDEKPEEDSTPTDVVIANDKTGIPDKNLYNAILAQAEILDNATKDGKLTVSEAEALRNLELNGLAISDLTGLDYCKNLYWVNLEDNQVSDISVFGKMPEIIGLVLDNNKVSDISPLKNFDGFSTLSLANNPIKDYSTLAGKHMDLLDLSNNNITDISFITTVKSPMLYLKNNNISDISALSSAWDILDWDLSGNQISDISVLANTSFSALNLSNNKISDVSPLAKQEDIFDIDLSNNNIRDISPLLNVEFLFLNVSNNNIRDLGTLADNVKERFVYEGNPIGEKETYTEEQFDKLLGENSTADVVIESSDKITITFGKGTMKEIDGVTNYDFTATTTTDYASSKLPTSVKADEFVLKISYNYSGNLPAEASVEIFVGKEYAKKDLYYSLLKDDGTLTETQKATVDAEGYMTVKQSHCSDWVITTTNPNPVSETPNGGTEGNTSSNGDSSDNKIDSPNTGDSSVLLSNIALVMAAALLVLYKKIKKA